MDSFMVGGYVQFFWIISVLLIDTHLHTVEAKLKPEVYLNLNVPGGELIKKGGEAVSLKCEVSVWSKIEKFEWYKNDRLIQGVQFQSIYSINKGHLLITAATKSHQGTYFCAVDTEFGISRSEKISLTVRGVSLIHAWPRLTPVFSQLNYSLLMCTVSNHVNDVATFTWTKDGRPVKIDKRKECLYINATSAIINVPQNESCVEHSQGVLILVHPRRHHAGTYACVTSIGDKTFMQETQVVVEEAIFEYKLPGVIYKTIGSRMTLDCTALDLYHRNHDREVWYSWWHNGTSLSYHTGSTISFTDIKLIDGGHYMCTATVMERTSNDTMVEVKNLQQAVEVIIKNHPAAPTLVHLKTEKDQLFSLLILHPMISKPEYFCVLVKALKSKESSAPVPRPRFFTTNHVLVELYNILANVSYEISVWVRSPAGRSNASVYLINSTSTQDLTSSATFQGQMHDILHPLNGTLYDPHRHRLIKHKASLRSHGSILSFIVVGIGFLSVIAFVFAIMFCGARKPTGLPENIRQIRYATQPDGEGQCEIIFPMSDTAIQNPMYQRQLSVPQYDPANMPSFYSQNLTNYPGTAARSFDTDQPNILPPGLSRVTDVGYLTSISEYQLPNKEKMEVNQDFKARKSDNSALNQAQGITQETSSSDPAAGYSFVSPQRSISFVNPAFQDYDMDEDNIV